MTSVHDALKKAGEIPLEKMWRDFLDGLGATPVWLLDVPHIANWEADIKQLIRDDATDA